jgi:hypothetical protein
LSTFLSAETVRPQRRHRHHKVHTISSLHTCIHNAGICCTLYRYTSSTRQDEKRRPECQKPPFAFRSRLPPPGNLKEETICCHATSSTRDDCRVHVSFGVNSRTDLTARSSIAGTGCSQVKRITQSDHLARHLTSRLRRLQLRQSHIATTTQDYAYAIPYLGAMRAFYTSVRTLRSIHS